MHKERRRWVGAGVALLLAVGSHGVAPSRPVAAGGPITADYPSGQCPQEQGLQGCIDSIEAGSTITVVTEIVSETLTITKSIRIVGHPDFKPMVDRIVINANAPTGADIRLRDLRVETGILAFFDAGADHELTITEVTVLGVHPNTGSGIYVVATVPTTFTLERSVLRSAIGHDNVAFDTDVKGGTTFRAIGNRLSQRGTEGANGIFVRHAGDGFHEVDLMNNVIWDVGACQCGFSAGIAIAISESARVDADIVGNTIERSGGPGIALRNDTEGGGFLRADIVNSIIAHTRGRAIVRETTTGATTTTVRASDNAVWRTASDPDSPVFGPGTRFVNPRFTDRSKGRLTLQPSSPLIDAGIVCSSGGVANPDAAGNHRLAGASVDIGAHERGAVAPTGVVRSGDDGPETQTGTSGADILCGYGQADLLLGYGGADYLDGGAGPDTIHAGAGRDRLFGRGGADRLCALDGKANDRLDGGGATDRYESDPGDTRIAVEVAETCLPT